jgi:lysophospholipase L1-like esterase
MGTNGSRTRKSGACVVLASLLFLATAGVMAAADAQSTASVLLPVSQRIETSSTKAWHTRCAAFARETTVPKGGVVLLGDSITARWPAELFPEPTPINRGIGSDHIGGWKYYGVLDRLDTAIDMPGPRRVYLMIGINDMLTGGPPMENMIAAYRELLRAIKRRAPQATVIVQSLLPVRGKLDYMNKPVVELNRELPKLAAEAGCLFVDLHKAFSDAKGEMRAELTSDGVHLNRDGYKLWADELRRQLK